MKLATKLLIAIFLSTVFVIIITNLSFYHISKSFYKHQLQEGVENRLEAHTKVLAVHSDVTTLDHVMIMEAGQEENSFVIFDQSLEVIQSSRPLTNEVIATYQDWIILHADQSKHTEFVETMEEHIPHAWSFTSFSSEEGVSGYLFLDQDTGSFEATRNNLLLLTFVIGFFAVCLAVMLSIYLSKRLSAPVKKAQLLTRKIALGDFEVDVPPSTSKDEVSELLTDISLMAKNLKEYRDERQRLFTNISHDLRTPLTYIKGYSALLKDQSLEPTVVQEQSNVIYREASRMEHLVNDLFQLMKYEEEEYQLEKERTNMYDFFAQLQAKIQLDLNSKQLYCHVHADTVDINVPIDQMQFERAIMNVLSNSIRHTDPGGQIDVTLSKEEKICIIQIRDNGSGIPEKDLQRIWKRFYRVDASRSTKLGGSGLGLAITKEIIHLLKGEISVSSKLGEGTTFLIKIPAE
ncbi:histidine kinase [Bacillus sp. LL01]|uniref:HAMP domain-containing sensor histidine kinase n=1 Tax=Bacillus sp. LL01 TaxID=1665556 RepID=UPI00064D5207|nr:HAMP domain-containing sensor histidine kinase [Bacillus sp. LL01]KMJ55104.1 histidine kinase [Bacillus sp. LL01]